MTEINSDDPVRHQYEAYPYPLRDPAEEKHRLLMRGPEYLAQINHFVFGGRQSFGPGTRLLVAGGGTGDEVVFMAEQLNRRGGAVTYLDQSLASMAIARARIETRGLANVEFRQGRIEDVSVEGFGTYDYVHSIGVLHHIADPALGLQRLAALLRPGGGMGLMVYGPHGRQGNYQLQALAKQVFAPDQPLPSKVDEMVTLIASLPPNHPYFRGGDRDINVAMIREDPNELVDMVLHARDQPFSVGEIYDWVATAGMTVVEFVPFAPNQVRQTVFTLFYDPCSYVTDPVLADRMRLMPARQRHEIAELMHGRMDLHCFYANRSADTEAKLDDEDMIPFLLPQRSCFAFADHQIVMTDYAGSRFALPASPIMKLLFDLMDGERTVAEIIAEGDRLTRGFSAPSVDLHQAFRSLYKTLRDFNWVMLRHRSVPAFANLDHLYFPGAGWSEKA